VDVITRIFGSSKSKGAPTVITGRSTLSHPGQQAELLPPPAPVTPAVAIDSAPGAVSLPTSAVEVIDVLNGSFRRMPFPANLNNENGGFMLLTNGNAVVCLRRQDMANTAVGYTWVRKVREDHPNVQVIDVTAGRMREAEQLGEAQATGNLRMQGSSTVQQQGFELVEAGIKEDASDIHLDVHDKGPEAPLVLIRLRINGELITHAKFTDLGSVRVFQEVNRAFFQNEATVLAGERNASVMNEAAGRFYAKLRLPVRNAEVRYELDTTSTGTTTTLRILDYDSKPSTITDLSALGFSASQCLMIRQATQARHGLMIFMGATGDGKTTSVAAALASNPEANKQCRIGMEQPPELHIPFMQQLSFPEDDFKDAMKGTLRQDPDVIYVGEINGDEVAKLAVMAALTGHLVPASMHANNVHSGLRRLVSKSGFGVSLEDISSEGMMQLLCAQMLAPTLCLECRELALPFLARDQLRALEALQLNPHCMYVRHQRDGNKCPHCRGRGVLRRTVLAEVVRPTPEFVEALRTEGVSAAMNLHRESRTAGYDDEDQTGKNVFEHGLYKASIGQICTKSLLSQFDVLTHPEVVRVRATARAARSASGPTGQVSLETQ
jgi:type II secretory ATPase GspE/PulE/Tfp pilus assembly ATPase PilB-like protein